MDSADKFYLTRRSNRIYYIGIRINGKITWRSTGSTSKAEALRALTRQRELFAPKPRTVTLNQFTEEFLTFASSTYSAATLDLYRRVFRYFTRLCGNVTLATLSARQVDQYKALRLREIKPVSINMELRALKAAFNTARRWKLITENPCAEVTQVEVPEEAPIYFTPEDFRTLILCIKEQWLREVVVFAVLTGMRRGEIINLKWEQVDFENRLLHIYTTPTFKTKKGKRRTIPLHEVALQMLAGRREFADCEYVFSLNGQRILGTWAGRLFKRHVYQSGLRDKRLHFHSLRHTFASWLVQHGRSVYEVQKLLGHTNIRTTLKYSHIVPQELRDAVCQLPIAQCLTVESGYGLEERP